MGEIVYKLRSMGANECVLASVNIRLDASIEKDIIKIADILGLYLKNIGAVMPYDEIDMSLYLFCDNKEAFFLDDNDIDDEALTRQEPIFESLVGYLG
ncbi:TPA: hypothetical protein ACOVFI_004737 [Citrobacter braakii]